MYQLMYIIHLHLLYYYLMLLKLVLHLLLRISYQILIHFVLLLLEGLRGKPLGSKAMTNIQMVGIALILALTVFSTFKDITR